MKRSIVLLMTVVALVLAACGSDQTDATATPVPTPEATPTQEPTPEPTETEAAETPEATDDDGTGSVITGELSEALPDEVGGLQREDPPDGIEDMFAGMLGGQGVDAENLDFAYGIWGQGEIFVTAFRIEGMTTGQLGTLAQAMAGMGGQAGGAGGEFESEETTVGGKAVLRMTTPDAPGAVYVYQADDAFFSVVTEDEALAEDLLSQLP